MDSMFNTPQEVVQANMNGAVKKATTSKKKLTSNYTYNNIYLADLTWRTVQ